MRMAFSSKAHWQYFFELPEPIRRAFDKQVGFLLLDNRHPSPRAKKCDQARRVWQAHVTGSRRFYFVIEGAV
jgi:hypothetical protein